MDVLLRVGRAGDVAVNVVGTMTRPFLAPPEPAVDIVGIRFRPGEALSFLDVAANDARDALLTPPDAGLPELEDLLDSVAPEDPRGWIRAIDGWLLDRVPRARMPDARVRRAVGLLHASHGSMRASEVAAQVATSERQLERLFAERVGVAPKVFARVVRLQALVVRLDARLRSASNLATIPWADLAAELGFADQAHLVREVRALAGITPTALVRERMSDLSNTNREPRAIECAH